MNYKLAALLVFALFLITGCTAIPPLTPQVTPQVEAPSQAEAHTLSDSTAPREKPVLPEPSKKAYITFDDGPNSYFTVLILDILKEYGVKATFVVVGSNIERSPEVFRRILIEGHSVVNHTYSHDYKKIYANPEAFIKELDHCSRIIANFTGEETKIFRAPGGPANLRKDFFGPLKEREYKSLGWNVSSADTDPKGVSPEQIITNVTEGVLRVERAKKAPVILLHDGTEVNLKNVRPGTATHTYVRSRESVVAALPAIIEFLQDRGYTLDGVDEATLKAM